MYLLGAKAYFGVWTPDDLPSLRFIPWRRLIRLRLRATVAEAEPVPAPLEPTTP
jgi:hypothetical protein